MAEPRAWRVVEILTAEKAAPTRFAGAAILSEARQKDLRRVTDLAGALVVLVDDRADAVAGGQQNHRIPVAPLEPPVLLTTR